MTIWLLDSTVARLGSSCAFARTHAVCVCVCMRVPLCLVLPPAMDHLLPSTVDGRHCGTIGDGGLESWPRRCVTPRYAVLSPPPESGPRPREPGGSDERQTPHDVTPSPPSESTLRPAAQRVRTLAHAAKRVDTNASPSSPSPCTSSRHLPNAATRVDLSPPHPWTMRSTFPRRSARVHHHPRARKRFYAVFSRWAGVVIHAHGQVLHQGR